MAQCSDPIDDLEVYLYRVMHRIVPRMTRAMGQHVSNHWRQEISMARSIIWSQHQAPELLIPDDEAQLLLKLLVRGTRYHRQGHYHSVGATATATASFYCYGGIT